MHAKELKKLELSRRLHQSAKPGQAVSSNDLLDSQPGSGVGQL